MAEEDLTMDAENEEAASEGGPHGAETHEVPRCRRTSHERGARFHPPSAAAQQYLKLQLLG